MQKKYCKAKVKKLGVCCVSWKNLVKKNGRISNKFWNGNRNALNISQIRDIVFNKRKLKQTPNHKKISTQYVEYIDI